MAQVSDSEKMNAPVGTEAFRGGEGVPEGTGIRYVK
jgi:hypothetical protein